MNSKKNFFTNPRKAETSTIKTAMQDLLNTYKIQDKFTATQIVASWARIMGEPIAKRTEKVYIKDKKLYVKITSAPLKQELSLGKDKIKALFTSEYGEDVLMDIVFIS